MADSNEISVKWGIASLRPEDGPVFPIVCVCVISNYYLSTLRELG